MLENIKKLAKSISSRAVEAPDPAQFADPLADQTDWTPLAHGGTNLGTHSLKRRAPHKMVFTPTLGIRLFAGVFIFVGGVVLLCVSALYALTHGAIGFDHLAGPAVLGVGFTGMGLLIRLKMGSPRTFDVRLGAFWKGRRMPSDLGGQLVSANHVPIRQIHALQLINEYCTSDKRSYYSYELNLVLKDSSRVNVVDHAQIHRLRRDADTLAAFLEVPVWDATS